MNALAQELVSDLDTTLKVIPFPKADPASEVERLADIHRNGVTKYQRRIGETKKAMRAAVATLEAERKAEKARHDAEMARIAASIVDVREEAARDVAADEKLAAASRAALDMLDS